MNNRIYIQAFSILEAALSMVVTAIILGIVFVIFGILSERLIDFKKQNQYVSDLNRLTYSINKDIFESEKLFFTDNNLMFYNYVGVNVRYTFNDKYLLRFKNEFTDTFNIKVQNIRIDTVNNKSKRSIYKRISINANLNDRLTDLKFFKKIYNNELLINLDKNGN